MKVKTAKLKWGEIKIFYSNSWQRILLLSNGGSSQHDVSAYKQTSWMKKRSETQTLRAGCSKAERKISPRRSPP